MLHAVFCSVITAPFYISIVKLIGAGVAGIPLIVSLFVGISCPADSSLNGNNIPLACASLSGGARISDVQMDVK